MLDLTLARTEAISAYVLARCSGIDRHHSAQLAWYKVREVLPNLRAPHWDEQLYRNTGSKRSYISPLGKILGIGWYEYGSHSGKYPRTQRSIKAAKIIRGTILEYLEGYFIHAVEMGSFQQINEAYDNL